MEYAEIDTPETSLLGLNQIKLIDSKKYEMKLGKDIYSLLMELYSNDKLFFK